MSKPEKNVLIDDMAPNAFKVVLSKTMEGDPIL